MEPIDIAPAHKPFAAAVGSSERTSLNGLNAVLLSHAGDMLLIIDEAPRVFRLPAGMHFLDGGGNSWISATAGHRRARVQRAYKVPSLRGVTDRAPYMHAGQFATLNEVVTHYNAAPAAPAGHSELKPLKLNEREVQQLVAFLRTLSGNVDAPPDLLQAPRSMEVTQ